MENLACLPRGGVTADRSPSRTGGGGLRILFAALSPPEPPTNGQALRNSAILQALAADGHQVSVVSFAREGQTEGRREAGCGTVLDMELVPPPERSAQGSTYLSRLRSLASKRPHGIWRFESREMKAALRRQLARGNFDLVICDDVYQMENLPVGLSVRSILNKHDLTHVIVRRYLKYEKSPFKQAYGWLEYAKLRRWEARACSTFDQVWTCSPLDREQLNFLCPNRDFVVVPNVIDVERFSPANSDDGATVLFAGSMDWLPNRDAVEFFVTRILTRIWEKTPGFKFVVAGRNPPTTLIQRFRGVKEVVFTGAVPDMREEIEKASVCVVPLRIGSGTRLKILEAAAMAKPVVSTSIGAEGLEFRSGDEILLADTPERFANAVVELLKDPERRRALGQAARRRVERDYSLAALSRSLRVALKPFVMSRDFAARESTYP